MNKYLITGDDLAKNIAKHLGLKYIQVANRTFPDGEIQPRIMKKIKGNVILAIRKSKNERIDDYIMRFYLLSKKLREKKRRIIGILPYLPYARQDKVFRSGEPYSAKYIAELIEQNLDVIITVNMHEHRKEIKDLFKIKAINLSVMEDLGREFKKYKLKNPIVIGPDYEAEKFAKEFASGLDSDYTYLGKARDTSSGKIQVRELKNKNLKGKDAIIIDDMVSSGETLMEAAKIAKRKGARSISLCFVHGLFTGSSLTKIKKSGAKNVMGTNTVENKFGRFDISWKIANALETQKLFK